MNMDIPFSFTFEGQVVALSDEIAQYTHDLEDSVRSGIISIDDVIKYPIIKGILATRNICPESYKKLFPNDPAFNLRTIIIHDYIGLLINDVKTEFKFNCHRSLPPFDVPPEHFVSCFDYIYILLLATVVFNSYPRQSFRQIPVQCAH